MNESVNRLTVEVFENPSGAGNEFADEFRRTPLRDVMQEENVNQCKRGDHLLLFRGRAGVDQSAGDLAVGEGTERSGDDARIARSHERGERFETAVADILKAFEERAVHECFVRAHAERVPGEFKRAVEFGRGAFNAPFALPRVERGGEFC